MTTTTTTAIPLKRFFRNNASRHFLQASSFTFILEFRFDSAFNYLAHVFVTL